MALKSAQMVREFEMMNLCSIGLGPEKLRLPSLAHSVTQPRWADHGPEGMSIQMRFQDVEVHAQLTQGTRLV